MVVVGIENQHKGREPPKIMGPSGDSGLMRVVRTPKSV